MTIGTLIYTWLKGTLVGTDRFGNRYYRAATSGRLWGRERRWVRYKGKDEASKVPAEWHAWLHHTTEAPLSEVSSRRFGWQKEHEPNWTGTRFAYRPQGHDLKGGQRAKATGDYEAWVPGKE